MNRRAFFAAIAGIAAGAKFDPERLLWIPGRKTISIPKPSPDTRYFALYQDEQLTKCEVAGSEYRRVMFRNNASNWPIAPTDWGKIEYISAIGPNGRLIFEPMDS